MLQNKSIYIGMQMNQFIRCMMQNKSSQYHSLHFRVQGEALQKKYPR